MKGPCCKSLPRCADCPVLLAARARGRFYRDRADVLLEEVLFGVPSHDLPPCVRDALAALDERRAGPVRPRL